MQNFEKKKNLFDNILELQNILSILEISLSIFLGPISQQCIAINNNTLSIITNGLDFLKMLTFSSKNTNFIIKVIEQTSLKTFKISSNGTTITSFFSSILLFNSLKYVKIGYNPLLISSGFLKIAYFSLERLNSVSIQIKKTSQLQYLLKTLLLKTTLPRFFKALLSIIKKLKKNTLILIEENDTSNTEVEVCQGIEIDKGFLSPYFVNDFNNFEVFYQNAYILTSKSSINSISQLMEIINFCKKKNRPLIIFTEKINKEILSQLIIMNLQKKLKVAVIQYKSIRFLNDEILNDLSTLVNSTIINNNEKIFSITQLGIAEKVIIKKHKSLFFVSKFAKLITARKIKELTKKLLASETTYEKEIFSQRISRLTGNMMKIKLGKDTCNKYEFLLLKQKIEQCVETLQSSLEEGFIPGASTFYIQYLSDLYYWSTGNLVGDETVCVKIIEKFIKSFLQALFKYNHIAEQLNIRQPRKELWYTYNYRKKRFVNSIKDGLFDSTKATRGVFWNSLNLVSNILKSVF